MKLYKYFTILAAMTVPVVANAQSITFDSEDEYSAISFYDTWEESPFRTGEMEGRAAVVTNHLNYVDEFLGEAANPTGKMLAMQRSRFGSNTFGVRIDLNEPFELNTTAKYVHALIYKPVAGRAVLVGLGKRNDREEQPQDVEQFWELASVDLAADKWEDAVFTIKGAGNISIYSLVIIPDAESPHNLTEDFIAYIDEIEVNSSAIQRIVYTDYALNFDEDATHSHSRYIKTIGFNGSSDGNQSLTLNTASNQQMYYNKTDDTQFTAKAGETITPKFTMNGNWMHGYVYIDRDCDGRFDADLNEDLSIADGSDVMSFAFYSGSTDGTSGVNSKGTTLTGSSRNVLNPPSFTLPEDLANGIYRMRYKIDWNSIDPGGNTDESNTIAGNGGAIVDVRLNIHGETTTISAHQRNCELLSSETGEGLGGTVVPFGEEYKIKVVPANGFTYRGVTVVHGYNIVIDDNQDYAITSEQYLHSTKQYSIEYIPASQFDENDEYTIPAEYFDGEVHVIADVVSGYSVRYNHLLDGDIVYTEVNVTTDGTMPAPYCPDGVTLSDIPTGTVTENCIYDITATVTLELPFVPAGKYEKIANWYYLTLKGYYLYYESGATSMPLEKNEVDSSIPDYYTFAFVGTPYTGYAIYNYAAGSGKILSSSTTMSGSEGGSSRVAMTSIPVPSDYNTYWWPTLCSYATNGFFLEQMGYSSNKANNRDSYVSFWTGGADYGSTFVAIERKMTSTDIDSIVVEQTQDNEAVYDLSGRRIDGTVKGLQIKGGKKILVK